MALTDHLGSWDELTRTLDSGATLPGWQLREPALHRFASVAQIGGQARTDEVLGALVRIAAAGDDDAVLVVLHLLIPGATHLCRSLRNLSEDIEALVLGQLAIQVRGFPVQRRTRAYAANVLLDAKAALIKELTPHAAHRHGVTVRAVEPADFEHLPRRVIHDPGEQDSPIVELVDFLTWAERSGVVGADDVAVLIAMTSPAVPDGVAPRTYASSRLGISLSTVGRRHDRAVEALTAARHEYLSV